MAPPVNDLLANATVVGRGFSTVSGTTVDATFSDEGAAGYNQPSVWYQLDTTLLNEDGLFWIQHTADFAVYGELYSVNTPTPDAEDLLTGAIGDYMGSFGDGTNGPYGVAIGGGSGNVGTGLYYFVYIADWNFDGTTGDFQLEFGVPWSVRAIDAPNLASSTVVVNVDSVGDKQYIDEDTTTYTYHDTHPFESGAGVMVENDTFSCGTMPSGGKFFFGYRLKSNTGTFDDCVLQLARGDVGFIPRWEDGLTTTVRRLKPCEPNGGGVYAGVNVMEAWPLWVAAGDEITCRVGVDRTGHGLTITQWANVLDVTFYPAIAWTSAMNALDFEALWPDATVSNTNPTPTAFTLPQINYPGEPIETDLHSIGHVNAGATTTVVQEVGGRDFVVLSDGTIYAAFAEDEIISGVRRVWLTVQKWNGSTWSEVTDDLWGRNSGGVPPNRNSYRCIGGISMDVDPDEDFVYIAWNEEKDSTASGTPPGTRTSYWRCKRLDTSDDSLTELGPSTGTTHYSTSLVNPFAAWYSQNLRLKVSPGGVPWVGWVESPTSGTNMALGPTTSSNLPFLYYWDGSAWQDSSLPSPSNMRTPWWDLSFIEEPFAHVDFTFCHFDGPSEYPSAAYNVRWNTFGTNEFEFIYTEYNGSTWTTTLQKRANLIWNGTPPSMTALQDWNNTVGHWHQGMSVIDDGQKPYIVACLGTGTTFFDYIAVMTIADDGSDFEPLESPFASQTMIPFGAWGWHRETGNACFLNGKIYVENNHPWFDSVHILGQGEAGDGTGWYLACRPNVYNWRNEDIFFSWHTLKAKNGKLWLLDEQFNGCLGIWQITPVLGGLVSMNYRSSDRRAHANRVLVGNG